MSTQKQHYPSAVIANWFLRKDPQMRESPMKLLKLVYISHGFHLAIFDAPLIKEEVQAWQYGPVIPELYFQHKIELSGQYHHLTTHKEDENNFKEDQELHDLLNIIYQKYGAFTGIQLSNLTHAQNTPWDKATRNFSAKISNEDIKAHYQHLLNG